MIKSLFINSTILISFLFIGSQFFHSEELSRNAAFKIKLAAGIISGLSGIVLIIFTVDIFNGTVLDFRQFAVIAASIYGGAVSSIIAGLMIASFRLFYFGIDISSILGAFSVLFMSAGCIIIARHNLGTLRKWLYSTLYTSGVLSILFILKIQNPLYLIKVLLYYWTFSIILGCIVYYCAQYISTSNRLIMSLNKESRTDFLTGLNNVRNFDMIFNESMNRITDKDEKLSILAIDIDYFKKVNDTYGHDAGDAVLKQLAEVLLKNTRSMDIVSRNGGEEFSVLLPDCSRNRTIEIAERIRKAVESAVFVLPDGRRIHITVSIGAAVYPDTIINKDNLLKQADIALYRAKSEGRNKVCLN